MKDNNIRLLEYFYSIDGETRRSGELVWFIRVTGCNLNCSWCDTDYCHYEKGKDIDIDVLVNKMEKTNKCRKVTITGGEPLIHHNIDKLIDRLLYDGWDVNIETNGSVSPDEVLKNKIKNYSQHRNLGMLWYSLDYKCSGSGMNNLMISAKKASDNLRHFDCYKFVVSSKKDLEEMLHRMNLVERYYNENGVEEYNRCTYYISPCFNTIKLPSIIKFMMDKNLIKRVKFQIQVHKIVWDPDKRGV